MSLLIRKIVEKLKKPANASSGRINVGYCFFGRNLGLFFIED